MTHPPAPPPPNKSSEADGNGGDPGDSAVSAAGLAPLALRAAEEAANLVRAATASGRLVANTKSSTTDLVTATDKASEELLVEILLSARPDDGVFGEEGSSIEGTSGVRWILDPIDGTTNFVYDHPGYSVSVAAEIDGTIAVGVVVDIVGDDIYHATIGGGAFRNDTPIRVGSAEDLARSVVATGFNYRTEVRVHQAQVLATLLPELADFRRMGSCAMDLCSVASGRVDAYFERGVQPWDHAAGALIAREAGAVVANLRDGDPDNFMCLAANPTIFGQLRSRLVDLEADVTLA